MYLQKNIRYNDVRVRCHREVLSVLKSSYEAKVETIVNHFASR